jgi:hypothetical protein
VWVTDARATGGSGNAAVKFRPDGKVQITIRDLVDPTDVITDSRTGDVYIAESHTDVNDPNLIGRISVFDRNGKLLRRVGMMGTGPGEFRTPHAIEFDSRGELVVADRHNHRIQIVTTDGKFVREYDDFGRTSGLAIDRNDVIYTTDSESTERVHPGWQRGIRIGSLTDGKVSIFIPPHAVPNSPDGAMGLIFRLLAMSVSGSASRTMKSALLPPAIMPVLNSPTAAASRVAATMASDGVMPIQTQVSSSSCERQPMKNWLCPVSVPITIFMPASLTGKNVLAAVSFTC